MATWKKRPAVRPRPKLQELDKDITYTSKSLYRPKETDWLNPIAMRELQIAVRGKKKEVVLNGTKFRIEYGYSWKSEYDGEHPLVKVSRMDGAYAPFGYISVKRINEYDFESDV